MLNQRFTSYDRSVGTGLDYAVNRSYSSGQGRFTSVDPIGAGASNNSNPQSLNLYSYVQNNPIDFIDPSGLFRLGIDNTDAKSVMKDIINRAISAVRNNNGCGGVFGSKEKAIEWLEAYRDNLDKTIKYKDLKFNKIGAVVGDKKVKIGDRKMSVITVNTGGINYNSSNYPPSGISGLSFIEHWALSMLHELGHALAKAGLPTEIGDDSQNTARKNVGIPAGVPLFPGDEQKILEEMEFLSLSNSSIVRDKCFPENDRDKNKTPTGGGGGGDFSGGGRGGYPSWWYAMQAHLAWVNSIPIYREEVTVRVLDD